MIATINGVTVTGTPEEIARFREITDSKKNENLHFNTTIDSVPEHVKKCCNNCYEEFNPFSPINTI